LRGYYSVFNPRGEKIADCGSERDAVNLIGMRNNRWTGHYYTFIPLPGDIIDVTNNRLLGWQQVSEKQFDEMFIETISVEDTYTLSESDLETFDPGYHD